MRFKTGMWRWAGLVLAAGMLQAAPASAGNDFFGIWTDTQSVPVPERAGEMNRIAATGVGVLREDIFWDRYERSPGEYDFSYLDGVVRDAAERGLRILPMLMYPPTFHRPPNTYNIHPPSDPASMAAFATAMVDRYGPGGSFWCDGEGCPPRLPMTKWQVWNEPNFPAWWKSRPDAREYAALLRATSQAIRAADPMAKVVSAGLTREAATSGYLDELYAAGARGDFDELALHPYSFSIEEMVDTIRATREAMARYGDGAKPILISEYGWATGGPGPFVTSRACQAALVHAATSRLSADRVSLNLSGVVDFMWNDRTALANVWPYWAGLVGVDGQPKPALSAFTHAVGGLPAPADMTMKRSCPAIRLDGTIDDYFAALEGKLPAAKKVRRPTLRVDVRRKRARFRSSANASRVVVQLVRIGRVIRPVQRRSRIKGDRTYSVRLPLRGLRHRSYRVRVSASVDGRRLRVSELFRIRRR